MQNTAMCAEQIGLCKFYELIRFLYEKAVTCNKEYTEFGNGVVGLEYKPQQQTPGATHKTVHIVLHGGGFIYGSPITVAKFCENLCNALGNDVIALKYPLAPEHIFPEPLIYVTEALTMFCNRYEKVHLVGVSAGANLALSASLLLKDLGDDHGPDSLTLIGGPYTFNTRSWSYKKNGDGPKLTKFMICQYWSLYLKGDQSKNRELYNNMLQLAQNQKATSLQGLHQQSTKYLAYCAPMDSNFIFCLPKTLLLVAEEDTLLNDSMILYRRLKNERSKVLLKLYPGPHIHLAEENYMIQQDVIRTIMNNLMYLNT